MGQTQTLGITNNVALCRANGTTDGQHMEEIMDG